MRISVDKDDAGYRTWYELERKGKGKDVAIFLDGIRQWRVLMADDEAGEVTRCVVTPEGNVAIDEVTECLLTETVKGRVEIQILERSS